ncbi:MAG: trehalose 6-phosphate synthase/phosphatase [Verrucomicrobiales bacterium]
MLDLREHPRTLAAMPKTLLVSNRLPVQVGTDGKPFRTTGGLASALAGAGVEATWVGWPGICTEDVDDVAALKASMASIDVKPVLLGREEYDGFYEGYSNGTLWPLLHYMTERARFEDEWFGLYQQANQKFADAVLEVAEDGDTVWIHDYQLFLLPEILRDSGKDLSIGFFLHTPFPSSEIFRALPQRSKVLRGLLGADLIGFHTYNYMRHFRSALLRVLGVESDMDTVLAGDRLVQLGVYPIGHDHVGFTAALKSDEFKEALARHSTELAGKKLLLSVERLDYTKGVPQKLTAIRRFLEQHREMAEEVVFVIIAVPSRKGIEEYTQLTENVQREVGAINGDFGTVGHAPLQFLYRSFPQTELAALYALADVCLVTPLIDGMNLVAKEYIDCKNDQIGARPGVLVLSEFAGAAQEMSQAILVNPHDVREMADAIEASLKMSPEEMKERRDVMCVRVRRNDSAAWARQFLSDLAAAAEANVPEEGPRFPNLAADLARKVHAGEKVALFLDYDGTLRDFVSDPDAAVPDEHLRPLLEQLAANPHVDVAVVSGRPASFLQKHFYGGGITLVSEHGYRWLLPGEEEWTLIREHIDTDWKDVVLPHLQQAADSTPGSHIEEKLSSLVWHYRNADPEFGLWQARGLLSEITDVTANLPVAVHHGKKIVEVASQLVNKGQAVKALVGEWNPDVVLAAGDDQTDETMFALEMDEGIDFVTVHIGNSPSRAIRQTSIRGIRSFLENFAAEIAKPS